jgi:hypothetical protein
MEQQRERVEKILTEEQREQLKQMRPRGRADFGPGRGRGFAPRGFDRGPDGPPIPGRYRWN